LLKKPLLSGFFMDEFIAKIYSILSLEKYIFIGLMD